MMIKVLQGMFFVKANIYVMNHLLAAIALHNVQEHCKILQKSLQNGKREVQNEVSDKGSEFRT